MQPGAFVQHSSLQGGSCSKQPYPCVVPMLRRSTPFVVPCCGATRLQSCTSTQIRAHSRPPAVRDSSKPSRCLQDSRTSSREQQPLHVVLTSIAAAAAVTLSSLLGPEVPLLGPGAAAAQPRMTPDEKVTIDIFKRSTPSVVNVTNLTAR